MKKLQMVSLCCSAAMLAASLCTPVMAADYPSKTITLLCGYAAGGSSDLLCRILANSLLE